MEDALRRHLAWQSRQLARPDNASVRFLVLRPGDKWNVCRAAWLASGKCFPAKLPPSFGGSGPEALGAAQHWDAALTGGRRDGARRLLPGLGNIAAALSASAVVAMLSRRVLLVENWTIATESFGSPLSGLVLGSSGWERRLLRAQARSRREDFASQDSTSIAEALCSHDLRRQPPAAVWRVFSNQWFAPLLHLNPHHAAGVAAMAQRPLGEARLWAPLVRHLFRPLPRLMATNDFDRRRMKPVRAMSMHLRCMQTLNGFCNRRDIERYAACARRRLSATNTGHLFVATMHARDRRTLEDALNGSATVLHVEGARMAERVETGVRWQEDGRIVDAWLLSRGSEILLSPASTLGYLAAGLADEATPLTLLSTCSAPPTREASFHLVKPALASSARCRERAKVAGGAEGSLWAASQLQY